MRTPQGGQRKILYYRNPMGAPDVSPTPKKDSMGMDYIPVYADEMGGPQGTVRLAPEKVQRAGVRTQKAERRNARTVRATGTVVLDETRVVTRQIQWLCRRAVRRRSRRAGKGAQPDAGLDRVAGNSAAAGRSDRRNARRRARRKPREAERNLRFFGFSDEAIDEIRKAGRPLRSLTFMRHATAP